MLICYLELICDQTQESRNFSYQCSKIQSIYTLPGEEVLTSCLNSIFLSEHGKTW